MAVDEGVDGGACAPDDPLTCRDIASISRCDPGGSGHAVVAPCPAATVCGGDPAMCRFACVPGERRCGGRWRFTCDEAGAGFALDRRCAGECVNGRCDDDPCEPTAEVCDGVDQDCDGAVDEEVETECYEGPEGTADVGLCVGGVRRCAAGRWGGCEGQALPNDEVCDTTDNDCDGRTDEETTLAEDPENCGACGVRCAQPGATTRCVDGACERIACDAGREDCNGADADGCETEGACGPDGDCDGADDDGDGRVDEDYVPVRGCGEGVCGERSAPSACVGGRVMDCQPGPPAGADDGCDGVDDDCDGRADEAFASDAGCGVGQCRAIPARCAEGVVEPCRPAVAPTDVDVICDGVDEDCDGRTDEDYAPMLACGQGFCRGRATPSSCVGGEATACEPGPPLGARDASCDGTDDDCDGAVDEDCEQGPRLPWLVVLDDAVASRARVEQDEVQLAAGDAIEIDVGDLLAARRGDGLLMHVEGVEDHPDGRLITGRPAALAEAVGTAEVQAHFDMSLERLAAGPGPRPKHGEVWGVLYAAGDLPLGPEPDLRVDLRDARVAFDTEIDLDLAFCGPLCLERFEIRGERILVVEAGLEVDLRGAARFERRRRLGEAPYDQRFQVQIGRLPAVLRLALDVEHRAEVDAQAPVAFSALYRSTTESTFAYAWSVEGGWAGAFDWVTRDGESAAVFDLGGAGTIAVATRAALHLSGFGRPGPTVAGDVAVTTTVAQDQAWRTELCAQVRALGPADFVANEVTPVDLDLADFCGPLEQGP